MTNAHFIFHLFQIDKMHLPHLHFFCFLPVDYFSPSPPTPKKSRKVMVRNTYIRIPQPSLETKRIETHTQIDKLS